MQPFYKKELESSDLPDNRLDNFTGSVASVGSTKMASRGDSSGIHLLVFRLLVIVQVLLFSGCKCNTSEIFEYLSRKR